MNGKTAYKGVGNPCVEITSISSFVVDTGNAFCLLKADTIKSVTQKANEEQIGSTG